MTRKKIFIIAVVLLGLGSIPVTLYVLSRYSVKPKPSIVLQQDVSGGPRRLKIGQKGNVRLTGTLYKNIDRNVPLDYVIDGEGWSIYADFPRFIADDISIYLGEEIMIEGKQLQRTVKASPATSGGALSPDDYAVDFVSVQKIIPPAP